MGFYYKTNRFSINCIAPGTKVFYWQDKCQALFVKEQTYIFINEELTNQQQWQDFCHELGLVFLHTGNQQRIYPV